MKKKRIILISIGILAFLLLLLLSVLIYYKISLSCVDKNTKENIEFTINSGEVTSNIIDNLEKAGLIKNAFTLKIYAKLNPGLPKAGTYVFSKAMSAKEIYVAIITGETTNDTVWLTIVEGKRLSYIVNQISSNFGYSEDEIYDVIDNKDYLNELIEKYDILTSDILNEKIYHPLEGYLFADTYEFMKDASIKEIVEKMLDNTESKISKYYDEIENSKYTIHEIMTLASIVELEGARSDDRAGVAQVFYNRLNSGMTLGSDVTTYYAVNKDFSVELTQSDLNSCNGYNTRGNCVSGLPVGPIDSPSFESIVAVIEPEENDFYYFVADKNGHTYFSKTYSEFLSCIQELKDQNMWYEY